MQPDAKLNWLATGFRPLVRGLSALFWGLPLALLVCMQGLVTDWLRPLGIYPPVFASALLLYGTVLIVRSANLAGMAGRGIRHVALLNAMINLSLSPFLYWWTRLPAVTHFYWSVMMFTLTSFTFLYLLNKLLFLLAEELPDEVLRADVQFFSRFNSMLIFSVLFLVVLYCIAAELAQVLVPPNPFLGIVQSIYGFRRELVLALVLLPVATTMSMLWKMKGSILRQIARWLDTPSSAPNWQQN